MGRGGKYICNKPGLPPLLIVFIMFTTETMTVLPTLLSALLIIGGAVAAPSECIENEQPCLRDSECCGGCCQMEKCVPYAEKCKREENPCSLHECPEGTTCYLHQVQCVAAPCLPVPACRDNDYQDYNDY